MQKLTASEPEYVDVLDERVHSMGFTLRPGEEIVRYFHHRGRWHVFENYPTMFKQYRSETGAEGPTERFWPRRQWGNGFFHYAPKLTPEFRDVELGADELTGVALRKNGLVCERESGHAQFAFESPYIYCGVPDPWRRVPSLDGATLNAVFELPSGGAARIEASAYVAGHAESWQPLWSSDGKTGTQTAAVDFTALADGRFRVNVRFVLSGAGSALNSFQTRMWFMVSPHSLPALGKSGENRLSIHSGDQHSLNTRSFRVERLLSTPGAMEGPFKLENLKYDPKTYSILLPQDATRPWSLTCELAAPRRGRLAWANVYALIEARKPNDPADATPALIEIADNIEGPWQPIASREILTHPQGWHFAIFGDGRFSGKNQKGFVRFSAKKGMKGFRIAAHYTPLETPPPTTLEIEHAWYEDDPKVGRRERTHIERTESTAHQYVVRCAQQPHNDRITLRVPSLPSE
jgi:hypothetical protein